MRKLNRIALIAGIVLLIGAQVGCGNKQYVYVEPQCQTPPLVSEAELPKVDVDEVYDALEAYHGTKKGRGIGEDLRKRERLLIDNLLEHRAIVVEVCGDNE